MEVLAGVQEDDAAIRAFLQSFHTIELSQEVTERAVAVRQTRKIKLPDAIIQATAQVHGRILSPRPPRDFPPGTEDVRIPYTF
jgi:hypothetical protein